MTKKKQVSRNVALQDIAQDTIFQCTEGRFRDAPTQASQMITGEDMKDHVVLEPRYDTDTKVMVVPEDTLVVCQQLMDEKVRPSICVLNMASNYQPGGGWEKGSMAQEEELFRRSNYFRTLKPSFYPLVPGSIIYSPVVTIIKDEDYDRLRNPFSVAMIAAAAPKYPDAKIVDKVPRYARSQDYEIMKNTIDLVFRTAYAQKHDVLVLGALGCGCYANPPRDVIDLFNKALQQYNRCFKTIIFAVYSKKDNNFQLFSEYIK